METQKSLKEIILDHANAKGFSLDKIFQLTNVPRHYLEALIKGDYSKLPAVPYVSGYLQKIAAALDLDSKELWKLYREEVDPKSSGPADKLPENRFAIKIKKRNWTWGVAVTVLIAFYLLLNADRLVGKPLIRIQNPPAEVTLVSSPLYTVSGLIESQDKLFINDEEVYADPTGQFQKSYTLQSGLNTLEFIVQRFLGKETRVVKQIIYQPNE